MEKIEIRRDADTAITREIAGALHDTRPETADQRVDARLEPSLAIARLRQQVELRSRPAHRVEVVRGEADEAERAAVANLVQ